MKPLGILFTLCLILIGSSIARADTPAATPPPANSSYNDPAMHFAPQVGWYRVGVPGYDPTDLSDPTTVAGYIKDPGKEYQQSLTIQLQDYDGSLAGFETFNENQIRGKVDVFVDKKDLTTLANGMPCYFVKMSFGNGFDAKQVYQYVVFDGKRGITVSVTGRLGELSEDQAKADLKDLAVVLYPAGR